MIAERLVTGAADQLTGLVVAATPQCLLAVVTSAGEIAAEAGAPLTCTGALGQAPDQRDTSSLHLARSRPARRSR